MRCRMLLIAFSKISFTCVVYEQTNDVQKFIFFFNLVRFLVVVAALVGNDVNLNAVRYRKKSRIM